MITVHYVIINPILRRNSVLKVAREVSADAMKQPKDDLIYEDENIDDEDDNHELSIRRGKDDSPTIKKKQMMVSSLTIEMNRNL